MSVVAAAILERKLEESRILAADSIAFEEIHGSPSLDSRLRVRQEGDRGAVLYDGPRAAQNSTKSCSSDVTLSPYDVRRRRKVYRSRPHTTISRPFDGRAAAHIINDPWHQPTHLTRCYLAHFDDVFVLEARRIAGVRYSQRQTRIELGDPVRLRYLAAPEVATIGMHAPIRRVINEGRPV